MTESSGGLFVGVDGGGTRCRVRIRDGGGRLVGAAEGGTANVYLDFDTAVRHVREAIVGTLARDACDGRSTPLRLGLGLAGVSGAVMAERVRIALADLGEARVTHDGDIACLGAHGGRDGGLIIAGTGSAAVARVAGTSTAVGGRGFIMGDDGSGARLGQEALRRALRAHDGLEDPTPLTEDLMGRFGHDPVAVIEWARAARSSDFGAYAPLVFSYANQGDPTARQLVQWTAQAVADLGTALLRLGAQRLCLVGGLSSVLRPSLPEQITAVLHDPLLDAQDGALLLAGCPLAGAGTSVRRTA